jgi:hypothetical protein
MTPKQAAQLMEAWGDKPCDHPNADRLGAHSGLEVCTQCGRVITRDKQGKPIPN